MVRAGCVFVAGIHPSRTWTSGSFESVRWNACMHRLDLGLYSHPKEFWGNGVWTHVNSKGKIPSTENVPRGGSNPRRCGQRAQALPTELFRPPTQSLNSMYFSFIFWLNHYLMKERRKPEYLKKTLMMSFTKCHILKPPKTSLNWDSNPHSSIGGRPGKQKC